jgi:hypothetical protein
MSKKLNTENLKKINPFESKGLQPDWIQKQHPDYVHHHNNHHSKLKKVEHIKHKETLIEITTEISVKINGQKVMLHASFDEEGNLQCHNTPYTKSNSIVDLVKTLINNTPKEAIPNADNNHDQHDHGNHHHHH